MITIPRRDLITAAFVCAVALMTTLLPISHVQAQPADPVIGTWELNLTKSRFAPGPVPRSQTRTYEEVPAVSGMMKIRGTDAQGRPTLIEYPVVPGAGIIKMSAKVVSGDGTPTLLEYTASYDGREYPFFGNPDADTISLKRLDDFTAEGITRKAGKLVSTGRREISKDGKIMTITSKGKNAKGEMINNTLVFDKR